MLRFLLVEAAQVTGEPDARINNDPYCRHVNETPVASATRTDLSTEAYRNQSEGRGEESYLPEQPSRWQWLLTAVSVLKLILLVVRTC